jgi:DNA repair exonuclease SbcCD ATPase subunit
LNKVEEEKNNQILIAQEDKEKLHKEIKNIQIESKSQANYFQIKLEVSEKEIQQSRLSLAQQTKEAAKREDDFHSQITQIQQENKDFLKKQKKEVEISDEILKRNKFSNRQLQNQIQKLEQEKVNLQTKLSQTEKNIENLINQQDNLIEQKEQLESQLQKAEINYQQTEQEKTFKEDMLKALIQAQSLSEQEKKEKAELKAKLEKEIFQLEQELNNEERIREQLAQALQIKNNRVDELENELINLQKELIEQLKEKEKKAQEELINKLHEGGSTAENHKKNEEIKKQIKETQKESKKVQKDRENLIIKETKTYLTAKRQFINFRQATIESLQGFYNAFEKHKAKADKIDFIGKLISSIGEGVNAVVPSAGLITKLTSRITSLSVEGFKDSKWDECTSLFKKCLVGDKENIDLFSKYHNRLYQTIYSKDISFKSKISADIANILQLSKNKTSSFGEEHSMIKVSKGAGF